MRIASTSRSRWSSSSGASIDSTCSSLRRSTTARSARPADVSRATRMRRSAGLGATRTMPAASSERRSRLAWPESRSRRRRNARTSHPSVPISHRSRASPSGRSRAR